MLFLKVLCTVLTGIGGHYLNRRWDKAILFLSLFLFYILFCFFAIRSILFSNITGTSEEVMQQFQTAATTAAVISLAGIAVLWALSIVLTIVDGLRKRPDNMFRWTPTGVVAASLTTVLSFLLLAYTAKASIAALQFDPVQVEETSEELDVTPYSNSFYEYVYCGGTPSNSDKLPEPPQGEGLLIGRILFENRPAEAVTLDLVLNGKYRARALVTDAEGMFSLKLPAGQWKINSIQTRSWRDKPPGDAFSIYYGGEAKLHGNSYDRYNHFQSDGMRVTVNEKDDSVHIKLTIKRNIELVWPDSDQNGVDATIADTIQWKPYPSAATYLVEIKGLRREGNTTHYNPITTLVLPSETAVPLSGLKHVKDRNGEKHEYAVEIFAFSADGTLIGDYSDTFRGGTFVLSDSHVLVEDRITSLAGAAIEDDPEAFQEKMERIALDRRRLDAADLLVDEHMVAEAKRLLELVDPELAGGRKEVLAGYILAVQGRCAEATAMFDQAIQRNPEVCIPDTYRTNCQ